jgi:hypothetical protein
MKYVIRNHVQEHFDGFGVSVLEVDLGFRKRVAEAIEKVRVFSEGFGEHQLSEVCLFGFGGHLDVYEWYDEDELPDEVQECLDYGDEITLLPPSVDVEKVFHAQEKCSAELVIGFVGESPHVYFRIFPQYTTASVTTPDLAQKLELSDLEKLAVEAEENDDGC